MDGPRALVVDDDEALLTVCARSLAQHRYRVEMAQDAESGLRALRRGSFDVLVSDIHMPGMSGVDLVAQLRADGLDIPVVLVTGDPQIETAIQAMQHGVLRYLAKPVTPGALIAVVNEVVRLHGIARVKRLALDNEALMGLVEELRRSKDAALAGTRAKSEFLSKMGHELRTPMACMMGMTDLALDTELTAEQREYLETVKSSANSLMKIIAHVLDLSALEGGSLELDAETFSVRDTLECTLKPLLPCAEAKGLSLMLDVGSAVPDALVGDPIRFAQVIDNLVNNAIKFTANGVVSVSAYLEAHPHPSEARVCVSISDTGIGIPKEDLARVVEAFSQGDNSSTRIYAGAGLGLTIAAQLAVLMNGSVKIESTPGVGTNVRFTVCLGKGQADDTFFLIDDHAVSRAPGVVP